MRDEPKRARRRRDLARMKARAKRRYPGVPKAHYWADYISVCSCSMCGNPRRRMGLPSQQELRAPALTCL